MAYAFNDDKSKFDLDETLDNVDNIAGSLATIEVSPVTTNHDTGEYIMYNNMLFQVTSPIATGEDLVLGTNVSPINIGDQLKTLQDSMGFLYFCKGVTFNCWRNDKTDPAVNIGWQLTDGCMFTINANANRVQFTHIDTYGVETIIWTMSNLRP